jgi:hypothetical protein
MDLLDVDPATLRLPPSRASGADAVKLYRQIAMISSERHEALRLFSEIAELVPEVRLGQLMANLSYMARGLTNESIWDMEDDELLTVAQKHLEEWRARRKSPISPPVGLDVAPVSLREVSNP